MVDGSVERVGVGEGLMGEVMGFEVAPYRLDVGEFGCVLGQPFDGQPVRPGGQSGERALACVDRTIVLDKHDRLDLAAGLRTVEMIDLLEMGDEAAAALGRAGVDDGGAKCAAAQQRVGTRSANLWRSNGLSELNGTAHESLSDTRPSRFQADAAPGLS